MSRPHGGRRPCLVATEVEAADESDMAALATHIESAVSDDSSRLLVVSWERLRRSVYQSAHVPQSRSRSGGSSATAPGRRGVPCAAPRGPCVMRRPPHAALATEGTYSITAPQRRLRGCAKNAVVQSRSRARATARATAAYVPQAAGQMGRESRGASRGATVPTATVKAEGR